MHDYNTILGVIELRLSKVSCRLAKTLPDRTERDCIDHELLAKIQAYHWMIFDKCQPQRWLISIYPKENLDI